MLSKDVRTRLKKGMTRQHIRVNTCTKYLFNWLKYLRYIDFQVSVAYWETPATAENPNKLQKDDTIERIFKWNTRIIGRIILTSSVYSCNGKILEDIS